MAKDMISISQHKCLKAAIERRDGEVCAGDNGTLTALLRRGYVHSEDGKVTITEVGRWAVDNATIDPKSVPTWMMPERGEEYIRTRGRKELRADANT